MLSVIIKDNGEYNVVKFTYEALWRELKNIDGAELLVDKNWLDCLPDIKNKYVCFVESDCMVSSGYFESQLGLLQKDPMMRKVAVMSSSTSVNYWVTKFFGYSLGNDHIDGVVPNMEKKASAVYPVEIAYIPGSIIHVGMLKKLLPTLNGIDNIDLVHFSTQLSLGFWGQGAGKGPKAAGTSGNRVHLNPNASYLTTEKYVNDVGDFYIEPELLASMRKMFKRQYI